jgi:hypothetical protein
MPRLSRRVLTLLLVTTLAATTALAQSPTAAFQPLRPALSDSGDLFGRLLSLLGRPWTKNGCEVDPSGRCLTKGSRPVAGDNGCEVDPSGGRCPATTKNGCELDPNGRCVR